MRPHKRGLEQNCLPLALTSAITPAVKPAQNTDETKGFVLRPTAEYTRVIIKHDPINQIKMIQENPSLDRLFEVS